jgi:acetyl esterase/lipase
MRRILFLALLALPAISTFAADRTWTGTQGPNWSNPANWSPQGTPLPGESLLFPAWAQATMNNDLPPGTVVGAMSFEAEGSLTGNLLTLTGNLSFVSSPSAVPFPISNDLTLGANVTIYQAFGKTFNGAIDVNGYTLTFSPAYSTVLRGPIRGGGTILINGTGLNVIGSGSFSGTIDGRLNVAGSYPNATIRSPRFSGKGTVGAVHAGLLYPGDAPPLPSGGEHEIGTLRTGSLTINPAGAKENGGAHNSNPKGKLLVDLVPGGASDQLIVRGTVTLDATLEVTLLGTPSNGQSFTIIDNDGTDAVNGRFTDLSEGAMFTVGSSTLWVSYKGGDGNDVVLNAGTPPPSAKTWTGATSANWSEPANWSPVGVPVTGDALLFPAGARLTTNNDLTGFVAGPMLFDDDYVLSGNAIALTGDLQFGGSSVDFVCNAPLVLRKNLRFQSAGSTRFNGPIDAGNYLLTIATKRTSIHGPLSGTSELTAEGEGLAVIGDGPFSGRFRGRLNLVGTYPNATVDGLLGASSGSGTVAAIAALSLSPGSSDPCCADSHDGGMFETKFLSIINEYRVDLHASGTSDRVRSSGPVNLYGKLEVTVHGALESPAYPIVEKNGTETPYGTFAGLPEGATFYAGDEKFSITYKGGDGNDVVLTRVTPPAPKTATTTTLTQNRATTEVHQPVTFTATVTSATTVPAGTVTFTDGSATLGTVTLVNGVAELTTKTLGEGTHTIVATYTGNETFEPSASAPVAHKVVRGNPNVTITGLAAVIVHGDAASFRVDVTSSAGDERIPAGRVTLSVDGTVAGTGMLAAGSVTIGIGAMVAGEHTIAAAYEGNEEFAPATASITQRVENVGPPAKASTATTLTQNRDTTEVHQPVTFTAIVTTAAGVPAGTVTFTGDGAPLGSVPLENGAAELRIKTLELGTHTIVATYSGSESHEASASTPLSHRVVKGNPHVAITPSASTLTHGDPVSFRIDVSAASADAGVPTGRVTLSVDGSVAGKGTLGAGSETIAVPMLSAGEHTIGVAYEGNEEFTAATASITRTVGKAKTALSLESSSEVAIAGVPIGLTIRVSTARPTLQVEGTVAVRRGGQTIGEVPLAGNAATAQIGPFDAGEYEITAAYAGSPNFEGASARLTLRVTEPAESVAYTYATGDGAPLQAMVYAPLTGDGPRPVILWIPGDLSYDAQGGDVAARRLTARGYAVVSVGYRPAGAATFPAQIQDLEAAVQWLRANAAELNVDPNRIAAWGLGAGGHLAALLGSNGSVQAVVTWGAITDPAMLQEDAPECSTMDWSAVTSTLPEGAAAELYASADDAALLLMHGAEDCVVGWRQSERLYEAVQRAGGTATLRVIGGVGHDDAFWASAEAFAEVSAFLDGRFSPARRRTVRR